MARYPNPDAVVYASTLPPRFPCQLTTTDTGKSYPMHNHGAWIDREGNGNTDVDAGHFHRVRGGRVLADPSDGHTHQLTMLPCGAGAPQRVARDGTMLGQFGASAATPEIEAALARERAAEAAANYSSMKKHEMWLAVGVGLAMAIGVTALIVHAVRKGG
jgi:hypothetical protein